VKSKKHGWIEKKWNCPYLIQFTSR
jgi:hypothetical protein